MLAFASLLLLADAAAALSLPEFDALPPAEAAARALEGQVHGPIDRVERQPQAGMPPETTHFSAYELPQAVPGGCRRTVWTLDFGRHWGDQGPQRLSSVWSVWQVALARQGTCNGATYVHVNAGLSEEQALLALRRLGEIADGKRLVEFQCRAEFDDRLCHDGQSIRRALGSETPFVVAPEGAQVRIMLKATIGLITQVTFDLDEPGQVRVEKSIPPPF